MLKFTKNKLKKISNAIKCYVYHSKSLKQIHIFDKILIPVSDSFEKYGVEEHSLKINYPSF
jgi:hypothetical protein